MQFNVFLFLKFSEMYLSTDFQLWLFFKCIYINWKQSTLCQTEIEYSALETMTVYYKKKKPTEENKTFIEGNSQESKFFSRLHKYKNNFYYAH